MALETDDCDIRDVHFNMYMGGNGDYYINLFEYPTETGYCNQFKHINYRMAMSGGFAKHHTEVKLAFVALYRAMEAAGLNDFPDK